jgi:hypothetical protein
VNLEEMHSKLKRAFGNEQRLVWQKKMPSEW